MGTGTKGRSQCGAPSPEAFTAMSRALYELCPLELGFTSRIESQGILRRSASGRPRLFQNPSRLVLSSFSGTLELRGLIREEGQV